LEDLKCFIVWGARLPDFVGLAHFCVSRFLDGKLTLVSDATFEKANVLNDVSDYRCGAFVTEVSDLGGGGRTFVTFVR